MRIAIISCYFGELPEYFKIWKFSCKNNKKIDFLFITDNDICNDNIKNLKVIKMSLKDLENLAKLKLQIDIKINTPYKLCDFKPTYGVIFKDFLVQYDFWGHCDIDQIFGNIEEFVDENLLQNYDRIQNLGHLTLYRNIDNMNLLFKKKGAIYNYKYVLNKDEYFAFDEYSGINQIAKKNKVKEYNKIKIADIDCKYKRYKLCNDINYCNQIFYWENGEIIRAYVDNNLVKTDTFCYLHFQKRTPEINVEINNNLKSFYITNNKIIKKDKLGIPTQSEIIKLSQYKGKKYEKKEKINYIKNKLIHFVKCNWRQKRIWLKQKVNSIVNML